MTWYRKIPTGQLFEPGDAELEERMRAQRDDAGQPVYEETDPPSEDEFQFDSGAA